jgi:spore maturation protein CgeB
MMQGWEPDLIVNVDAGIMFDKHPVIDCPVVSIATDPHYLDYDVARTRCDTFYNMQKCYCKGNDKYLPYAFDPTVHYPMPEIEKTHDCVLIGVTNSAYQERIDLIRELRLQGVSVLNEVGPIFDEYREMNNKASIGIHSSTKDDLAARVFELPAMGLAPVINRVPDLVEFFDDGSQYLGFTGIIEGIEKVKWLKDNPGELKQLSKRAYDNVWKTDLETGFPVHSYDNRVHAILKDGGFIG